MKRAAIVVLTLALAAPLAARAAVMTSVPVTATTPAVPVYVAKPRGAGPFPAVLVLHGCEGLNSFYAFTADRLAARGYVGVALDSLGPREPEGACNSAGAGSTGETIAARATLAWLRTQPYVIADRLAVIGFSMGGIATLDLIDPVGPAVPAPPGLRVAVAFYPSCEKRNGNVTVPLAIFDGDADRVTPAGPCAEMVRAGTAAGKTLQITTYPGATHGFPVPGPDRTFFGQPIHFDASAAADSAQKTVSLLAQYLEDASR